MAMGKGITLISNWIGKSCMVLFIACMIPAFATCQADYKREREHMVTSQLKARDIRDKATLHSMGSVPRHKFVPPELKGRAYEDGPLAIGKGQTISQPYIVAYMTQALDLKPHYKVLEVGTGSGYQAAVLSNIVDAVYSIEIVPELGETAMQRLDSLGYKNVHVRIGDGYNGWPEKAPFDAIIVTAGAEFVPGPLLMQLKDGGRMVIPVGPHHGIRKLKLFRRKGDKIKSRDLMNVRFVPLTRNMD